jgi:hemoglobin
MIRFLCTLLLAASAACFSAASNAQGNEIGLYQAFGAKAGLATLMNRFVERLAVDARTKVYFEKADKARLKEQLTEQLCMLSGGPCVYTGAKMRGVHRGLEIGRSDFNALVEVLQDCMDEQGIAFATQNDMLSRLAPMHREIVTRE